MIVAAGDVKVDNGKFKARFAQKAKMIPFDMVEELTGFKPGGVCPFCAKDGVAVYLDESLKRFDVIYPAAGSSKQRRAPERGRAFQSFPRPGLGGCDQAGLNRRKARRI